MPADSLDLVWFWNPGGLMNHMCPPSLLSFFLITILVVVYHLNCEARDSINVTNPLNDTGETLVSAGNRFELGFFTPEGNEKGKYVGIWYKFNPRTIVWVANRDKPLRHSCGVFGIAEDGDLSVWCSNGDVVPIIDVESSRAVNRKLQLLDSGNLILVDGQSTTSLWQSFNNPTDTFLPGMKMDSNVALSSWISPSDPGKGIFTFRLSPWRSANDPGSGNYTFRQDQGTVKVYSILNGSNFYWKSGEPGTFLTNGLPPPVEQLLSYSKAGLDQNNNQPPVKGNKSISFRNYTTNNGYEYERLVMNSSGEIQHFVKFVGGKSWSLMWSEPKDPCSVYAVCGKFSVCDVKSVPMCKCPPGFKPASSEPYSEGCDRELPLCHPKEGFQNLPLRELWGEVIPFNQAQEEKACKKECLSNCKCEAYSYTDDNVSGRATGESATKCWILTNNPANFYQDYVGGRANLSLRISFSAPDTGLVTPGKDSKAPKNKSQRRYLIVFTVLVAGVILVSCCSYILYRRRRMAERPGHQGNTEANPALFPYESERQINDLMHENDKRIDVPFYNLDAILSATDNFSDANKLGQGGFGPVYKGKFPGGREIAVKRLSSCSGQGIEEFLNEVVLIAKLQHRNLVRLLGYCIKGNEKILLYEYMPNRSLDAFIFDEHKCLLLDWSKRFDIILGIARGLLYLHQDSRLRIIHRDLKTSNVLLDEDMNPKISDFGLARIVEGKGTEASTNKVVGTYGYMSPEYAMDGKFSIKSDVFSFGVVMLEIISGKKTTGFYNPHEVLNLLGYAWRLWSENKALDLVDATLLESCDKSQVMKCINIGLLCVQEDPNDRPTMSTVVIMVSSETTPLPPPNQPAFVVRKPLSSTASSSSTKPDAISKNELTISVAQGR